MVNYYFLNGPHLLSKVTLDMVRVFAHLWPGKLKKKSHCWTLEVNNILQWARLASGCSKYSGQIVVLSYLEDRLEWLLADACRL